METKQELSAWDRLNNIHGWLLDEQACKQAEYDRYMESNNGDPATLARTATLHGQLLVIKRLLAMIDPS